MPLDRERLAAEFRLLDSLPADASAAAKRKRGQQFEEFLHRLLAASDLAPRTRYRPDGEEIDGSFELSGRVYLLEAKWHQDPLPASAIYAFKGKVDGKLSGTLGVFISMSGYSKDAVEALSLGKTLNVILADRDDVLTALASVNGVAGVLQAKLRAAAEEGVVYFRVNSTELTVAKEVSSGEMEATIAIAGTNDARPTSLVVVCEGPRDEKALAILASRILQRERRTGSVRFVVAMGKRSIPRVLNGVMTSLSNEGTGFAAVADGDYDPEGTERLIRGSLEGDAEVVVVDPGLEAWFIPFAESPALRLENRRHWSNRQWDSIAGVPAWVDLTELRSSSTSFEQFYELIVRHSRAV